MGRLSGKVALITGAARGQGRAHAVTLAREGARICAVDICEQIESVAIPMATEEDLAETEHLVEQLDQPCLAIKADTRDPAQMQQAVERTVAELGGLDTLVINHGVCHVSGWDEVTDEEFVDALTTNVIGVWNAAKAGIPQLIEEGGGSIVITSSPMGVAPMYGLLAYVAAKHGSIGLMRNLSAELAPHSIRVNAVLPTTTDTPMINNPVIYGAYSGGDPNATRADISFAAEAMNLLPIDVIAPEEISNAVLFLVSDESRYVTGLALPVDAGLLNQPCGVPPIASEKLAELSGIGVRGLENAKRSA
jgi:(+)-trans-carveol dehydrogenase